MKPVAIGTVMSERGRHQWDGWRNHRSQIHILPQYAEGLEGIEAGSHILVVYAMDTGGKVKLKVTPQGKAASPTVGLFASRCPWRPTPIGVTTVKLLAVEGNVLQVEGLDAIDGTQVLDIKPYWPQYDGAAEPRYPSWVDGLEF